MILFKKRITKALIRLRGCHCCSQTPEDRFSCDEAHLLQWYLFAIWSLTFKNELNFLTLYLIETPFNTLVNRADPDQAALVSAAWSESTLFANGNMIYEPVHEISNNLVCATSKASDQPAHMRSLIRAFASRLSILWLLSYWPPFGASKLKRRLQRLVRVYTCQNIKLLEISRTGSYLIYTSGPDKECLCSMYQHESLFI